MELDLNHLNLSQLREIAKSNNLKNIAKYRKQELIDLLTEELKKQEETQDKANSRGKRKSTVKDSGEGNTAPKNVEDSISKTETDKKENREAKPATKENPPEDKKEHQNEDMEKPTEELQRHGVFKDKNGFILKENIKNKSQEKSNERNIDKTEKEERISKNEEGEERTFPSDTMDVSGVLEIQEANNFGFLRGENYLTSSEDVYVSPAQIRRFHLKTGDEIKGKTRPTREGEKFKALIFVEKVNGDTPDKAIRRRDFDTLTPVYPSSRLYLENKSGDLTTRIMDVICPIGKGQRGLIVAPPKAGKTTILKKIAQSMHENNSELKMIVLLIDERPEEVTDMRESIEGEVIYSTFDEDPMNHIKVAEMVLERAKRMVEQGQDVVILLDSLTRLSRAYNLTCVPSGRTLTGGLDPAALMMPKKFFGAARNIRNGGSLTILATALIETGSRMDDVIFEEFKGTGNMEVHLDRKLQERRIFPAIDIFKSGTRKEELLFNSEEMEASRKIRSLLYKGADVGRITEELISLLDNTENNREFTEAIKKISFNTRD